MQLNAAGQAVTFPRHPAATWSRSAEMNELPPRQCRQIVINSIMVATPDCLTDALIRLKSRYRCSRSGHRRYQRPSRRLVARRQTRRGAGAVAGFGHIASGLRFSSDRRRRRNHAVERIRFIAGQTTEARSVSPDCWLPWILQPRGSPSREGYRKAGSRSHHQPLQRG